MRYMTSSHKDQKTLDSYKNMKEANMAYKEVEMESDMYEFVLDKPLEGEYKQVRQDVGMHKSRIYTVGDTTFWGSAALDVLMDKVALGDKVRITLTDSEFKFPSGQTGKNFKVEVDE